MIDKIISTIFKTTIAIFLLFTLITAFVFVVLKIGIGFESLNFKGVTIEKPYFKIDKRLNFTATNITITPSKTENRKTDINKQIKRVFEYIKYIETIDINSISFNDNNLSLKYNKELFLIENSDGKLSTKLEWINIGVLFKIEELIYNKINLKATGDGFIDPDKKIFFGDFRYSSDLITGTTNINANEKQIVARVDKNSFKLLDEIGTVIGTLRVDLKSEKLSFNGEADFVDIKGSISVEADQKKAKIKATDVSSKSLEKLTKLLPLNDAIKSWIYGNITAEYYDAKEYYLEVDLKSKKPLLDTMRLDAYALNTDIKFHPEASLAFGKKVSVTIKNSTIDIQMPSGEFEGQKADATVKITDLFDKEKVHLNLVIDSDGSFDSTIRDLIANYGVDLAIKQTGGQNSTNFELDIDFKDPILVQTHTKVKSVDSLASLYILDLNVSDLELETDNNIVKIPTIKSSHSFWKNSDLTAYIDAKKNSLKISGYLEDLSIVNNALISTPKIDINLSGKWDKDGIVFRSDEYTSDLNITHNGFDLKIADLSKLKEYIPAMDLLDINAGKLDLNYSNNQTNSLFSITTNRPIFYSKDKPIVEFNGTVRSDGKNYAINILDRVVSFDSIDNSSTMLINGLTIDAFAIERFLKRRKDLFAKKGGESESVLSNKFFIFGKNSTIKYSKKELKSELFSVHIDGAKLEAEIKEKNASIVVSKNGDELIYKGKNIGANWINSLANVKMKSGKWSFTGLGSLNSGDHYGVVNIEDSVFKEARFITNIIAVINTVPALVQFRSPGFTSEGFEVEQGVIEFYYANSTIFLNSVRLYGKNTDIIAQGSIDLKRNKVDIYASIQSVKGASKIIGNIPLFGYLLLGDSKRIENVLHITGTLDNPEVKSEAVKELLFYPLGVAKRILTLPTK